MNEGDPDPWFGRLPVLVPFSSLSERNPRRQKIVYPLLRVQCGISIRGSFGQLSVGQPTWGALEALPARRTQIDERPLK